MNFFKNIAFLSKLASNNFLEYFKQREPVHNESLSSDSINWYGHATTIVNMSGILLITDPVFSNRLGIFKRLVKKPYEIKDFKFDYIIISHGHMDHLDISSLRKLDKNTTIIVPRGYKKLMSILGFKNIIVLKHNDVYEDENIKISSLKAEHDGRRFYLGKNDDSNSYLIERNNKTVFFAGDTAYTSNFDNLKSDVSIMPVGCYKPDRFTHMHCSPEQSYKMYKNMNSKAMIPVHYKTFKISLENFEETYESLINFKDDSIKILDIGQTYKF